MRRALVTDLLLGLKAAAGQQKIFPMAQDKVRKQWHRILGELGCGFAGPLHAVRHSGPSEDLARGRSSLEQVRRRGRWKSMDSVQRYTKSFALTRFRAKVPEETATEAERVHNDLRAAVLAALRPHRRSELGAHLWTALQKKLGRETVTDAVVTATKEKGGRTKKPKMEVEEAELTSSDTIGWATD